MDYPQLINNMPAPNIAVPLAILDQTNQIQEVMKAEAKYNAEKDAALFQTAEASMAQKELLTQQLNEVKAQNQLLKKNYLILKELYDTTKKQAESSSKEAKNNKIFGWVSFGVGTLIGIVGIVIGIII